jgi:nicotinamide phosphoribosyltransferase
MMNMIAAFLVDGYKLNHWEMFPEGTEYAYSNFTPRSNKYAPKGCDEVMVFGTTYAMRQIHWAFEQSFFKIPKEHVISQIRDVLTPYFGMDYDITPFEKLHDLGYLPIRVKALEEGTLCPIKVPMLTIVNTHKSFYWLPNFLETILSNSLWKPMTSATIAFSYKKLLTKWALATDKENVGFVDFQAHDFSMRGLDSVDATIASGLGHLTSFKGTDSLPAIIGARQFYQATGFVAGSVPASEHSVMCAGGKESELETFRRLLRTFAKAPILSVVSDTWDLWKVVGPGGYVAQLKEEILAGNTKLVIRPDSGDPVDIICGFIESSDMSLDRSQFKPFEKGVIELLWDIFGGTVNEQGYKVLHPKIGAIYGDSITVDRAEAICQRLANKGFASTNIVLGVGSYTYQFNTRDTFGFAMKATWVQVNGIGTSIFKDPITDDGMKKSAKGLIQIIKQDGKYALRDGIGWKEEREGELKLLYEDNVFYMKPTLDEIRDRVNSNL